MSETFEYRLKRAIETLQNHRDEGRTVRTYQWAIADSGDRFSVSVHLEKRADEVRPEERCPATIESNVEDIGLLHCCWEKGHVGVHTDDPNTPKFVWFKGGSSEKGTVDLGNGTEVTLKEE